MSEKELYKLLNIPNKPWIELTDEEIQLFEKNNNYIKQLQQENTQLKRMLNIKENLDKKETTYEWNFEDMFDMREENTLLQQQLKDKDEKISKVIELLKNPSTIDYEMCGLKYSRGIIDIKLFLEILESNKED